MIVVINMSLWLNSKLSNFIKNYTFTNIIDCINIFLFVSIIILPLLFTISSNKNFQVFKSALIDNQINLSYLDKFKNNLSSIIKSNNISIDSHNLKIIENFKNNSSLIENEFYLKASYLDFYKLIQDLRAKNFLLHINNFSLNKLTGNQLSIKLNTTFWSKS